jgi:hypothetical protein
MPDKTWIAGDVVTAADTNTYLTHTGGAWTAYTPAFTNLTVGNGTLDCQWFRSGRFVSFKVKLTFGSTTSVSGDITCSLPVAYADGTEIDAGLTAMLFDASANTRYPGQCGAITTTTFSIRPIATGSTYASQTATSSTIPFTWTTSDLIVVAGSYEAAS